MKTGDMGRDRACIRPGGVFDRYEQGFADLAKGNATGDRDFIASILLAAVEQSFKPHEHKPRAWLQSIYAQSLFILLDISPTAAMEHLSRKWRRIDDNAVPPGYVPH